MGSGLFQKKKEDDLAWEERQANEEKERRATECYQKAEDIKKTDLVQARELYREAAELGHRKAQYQYGWYCLRGIGGEKDPQQAFENLTKADEMRRNEKYDLELERDVHYALGLCYSQGAGTERNDSEAVTRLEWAAEHGSSGAAVVAGNVYKRHGQKSDAERMYRTAAGQGSVMSIYEVAQICMGKEGNLDAYREALELFEAVKLADASREEACEEAIQTLKGYIAEEQQKEAKAYFEDGGKDAISLEQAKELYQDAIEEMKQTLEYKTVTDKLEKAAFGSYAPAEFLCGYFWIKGMTKTQNPFIAAEWIRRAVNQDYIEDNLVEYDWFLAQDEALAARILELGKQRGSAFALYRQGSGRHAERKYRRSDCCISKISGCRKCGSLLSACNMDSAAGKREPVRGRIQTGIELAETGSAAGASGSLLLYGSADGKEPSGGCLQIL